MIRRWLTSKMIRVQQHEAEAFLTSLKGADVAVIDMTLAVTMHWAEFYKARNRDLYLMANWIEHDLAFPLELNRSIRDQQKQGAPMAATGLMVWLHSARALCEPQLRLLGRQIWEELASASVESEAIASDLAAASQELGVPVDNGVFDYRRVPLGLEANRNSRNA